MLVGEFLAKKKFLIMFGLGPRRLFLSSKLKIPIKRARFATITEIKEKSKQEPLTILKSPF